MDWLEVKVRVMLELGLTPFSEEVKKFTPTHWLIFYKVIREREKDLLFGLAEMLGVRVGKRGYVPFGYVVNSEVMKEVERLKEIEALKEEREELKDYSQEELMYLLDDIEKRVKGVSVEKTEW